MIYKCKSCGGNLEVKEGSSIVTCDYCGVQQTIPKADDENKLNLFNRANELRLQSEFDKAIGLYESIVSQYPKEAEAYWCLCLCKYGIEYVDDPKTKTKIPTCHRTLFSSIFEDEDYLKALDNADVIAKKQYEDEAREIDRIQKDIIKVSQKEDPYDIFICYKETDKDGKRTQDSVIAQDIYDKLTEKGYKVFFARITLESKLGLEYEPIIFAALRSSKIMLAIGTKQEYFNAVWVKNEWSRFLTFMQQDKDKYLFPCYRDMDAYDMPEEFISLQSQDLSKIGYIQDLTRGIDKIFGRDKVVQTTTIKQEVDMDLSEQFEDLENKLAIGDFDKAEWVLTTILTMKPKSAKAHFYKFLKSKKFKSTAELLGTKDPIDDDSLFKKALDLADTDYRKQLESYANTIRNNKKEGIYNLAKTYMISHEFVLAIENFRQVSGYRDALGCIEKCKEGILEDKYIQANKEFDNRNYSVALEIYKELNDYRNSKLQIEKCNEALLEGKYISAVESFNSGKLSEAKKLFNDI